MVSRNTKVAIGIVALFGAAGGFSLVRPAVNNAKKTGQQIKEKVNELKEGARSG